MTITSEEAVLLTQFRKKIESDSIELDWYSGHDDNLVRWLRAREMNLDKAFDMFKKHIEWRQRRCAEGIMSYSFPENLTDELPFQLSGFDTEGCPVVVTPFGRWDLKKFVDSGRKQLILDFIEYLFEVVHVAQKSRSTPSRIHMQAVLVLDYEGFSLRQMASRETIDLVLQILRYLEANQPEMLKLGCIINAPRIFELFFRLCKPLLTARTLSKVQVFGSNANEWKTFLRKNIPHGSLPSQYGGSNSSCMNFKLTNEVTMPTIPMPMHTFDENDMEAITLDGGQRHVATVECASGQILRWSFRTDLGDMNFQLNTQNQRIINLVKIDSHTVAHSGAFVCPADGKYELVFEHPYRRQSPVQLYWKIQCLNDDDGNAHKPDTLMLPDVQQTV